MLAEVIAMVLNAEDELFFVFIGRKSKLGGRGKDPLLIPTWEMSDVFF